MELLFWTVKEWLMTHKGNWASGNGKLDIWQMSDTSGSKDS